MQIILFLWYLCILVQSLLGLGTAYRLTKGGGDNGIALWGWIFLMNLAALIPGLGFVIWNAYRDETPQGYYRETYNKPRPKWMQGSESDEKHRQEMIQKMNQEIKRNEKDKKPAWFDIGNPF